MTCLTAKFFLINKGQRILPSFWNHTVSNVDDGSNPANIPSNLICRDRESPAVRAVLFSPTKIVLHCSYRTKKHLIPNTILKVPRQLNRKLFWAKIRNWRVLVLALKSDTNEKAHEAHFRMFIQTREDMQLAYPLGWSQVQKEAVLEVRSLSECSFKEAKLGSWVQEHIPCWRPSLPRKAFGNSTELQDASTRFWCQIPLQCMFWGHFKP